jgi:hypothetical protein
MDHTGSEAPEYLAWERWHAGWIDDEQILCLESDSVAELTRIEAEGGTKAAIVPVGPTEAVVVESRRAVGYDLALTREGAVVYLVDTSIESGQGPIRVVNDRRALLEGEVGHRRRRRRHRRDRHGDRGDRGG